MNTFNKEEYNTPQWKQKRLEIINRDYEVCELCGNYHSDYPLHSYESEAQEFHKTYNARLGVFRLKFDITKKVWEYPNSNYVTLCSLCSSVKHHLKLNIKKINQLVWIDETEEEEDDGPDWDWISREGDEIMMEGMSPTERRGNYDDMGEQSLMLNLDGSPFSDDPNFSSNKANNFKSCCLLHVGDIIQFIFMTGKEKSPYVVFKMRTSKWLDFIDSANKLEFNMQIDNVSFHVIKRPPETRIINTIDYFDEHYEESELQPQSTLNCGFNAIGDSVFVTIVWRFENDLVPKTTNIEINSQKYKDFQSEINPSPLIIDISDDIRLTFTKEIVMDAGYIIRYDNYQKEEDTNKQFNCDNHKTFECFLKSFNDRVKLNYTSTMREDNIVSIRNEIAIALQRARMPPDSRSF